MCMGNVANIWRSCGESVEPAEEANMEAGNVAMVTEQPTCAEEHAGQSHQHSGKNIRGIIDGDELGTSVDDIPLIDLSSSSKDSLSSESQVEISAESDQETRCNVGLADVQASSDNVVEGVSQTNGVMNASAVDSMKQEKIDRLAKIAEQIDDFDPSPLLEKSVESSDSALKKPEGPFEFTGDINDDELIDKLLEEPDFDIEAPVNSPESDESDEREATSCKETVNNGECNKDGNAKQSATETADTVENGQQNGEMSASTESEGCQEEKSNGDENGEKLEEETEQNKATDKNNTQRSGTASPTKTAKNKRKEDKSIEHILKALSSLQTTEEKLAALCKKYADLHEDHRVLQSSFKQNQRKLTVTTREKDQLQAEHTKAVMAKSKLESLCRELQKHNQTIRQESLQRAKEEDEKRKEISQKFQTTIGEIQTQMQENHERNKQLREENFELANKLKKFIEQYEAREKQVEKVIQHRELEQKLADAKLEQASAILMEEKGKNQKEKELLLLQTTEYLKKIQIKDAELNMYKERYEEFQSTIKKSEEMFSKFKVEMDKMTKRCKKMEKDGAQWRGKWENANRALLEMAEEKTKYDKERSLLMTKITKLESLCRAMQAERQARKLLESEHIAVSAEMEKLGLHPDHLSVLPDDPEPSCSKDSVDDSCPVSEQSADSTTPGEEEDNCPDTGTAGEGDSDNSYASEQTGITVIEQNPPDSKPCDNNQSEGQIPEVTSSDQSEASAVQDTDKPES